MDDILRRMQHEESPRQAECLRLLLEERFVPNQVLREGAGELIEKAASGFKNSTNAGQLESWEILAQLAAGAVPPTSADPGVLAECQFQLRGVLPHAAEWLARATGEPVDYLVIDVLDAVLSFSDGPTSEAIVALLENFASRGDRERMRVQAILEDEGLS